MTRRMLVPLAALAALAACRPDPGAPQYPSAEDLDTEDTGEAGLPEGPDPYVDGEERLAIGLYYESGYSELIPIDDVESFYYIYENTYTEGIDLNDVVEGRESAVLTWGSLPWMGGGVTWTAARDLSAWTTLHVSMRSGSEGFANANIHMVAGGEGILAASDYGWTPDGQWQHLAIPLADFAAAGADLTQVTGPWVMITDGGTQGDEIKIDNLYFTQD